MRRNFVPAASSSPQMRTARRLLPLLAQASPWRPLALESQAWLALRTGQRTKARDILKGLQADAGAPDGVRARAAGLLTRLDDVPDPVKGAGG